MEKIRFQKIQEKDYLKTVNTRMSLQSVNILLIIVQSGDESINNVQIRERYLNKFKIPLCENPYATYSRLSEKGYIVYDEVKNNDTTNRELHGRGNYRKYVKATSKAKALTQFMGEHYV